MSSTMNVVRIAVPVTNLGFGRRIALWLAGCSIGCKGCCSVDTWSETAGRSMTPVRLGAQLLALAQRHDQISGITISGGEPTDSAMPLHELLARLRLAQPDWDFLMYSGRSRRYLEQRHQLLLEDLDMVIPEPFVHNRPSDDPLLGSSNQFRWMLTEKARQRYGNRASHSTPPLSAAITGAHVRFTGIPAAGSLNRFEAALLRRGISLSQKSWSKP